MVIDALLLCVCKDSHTNVESDVHRYFISARVTVNCQQLFVCVFSFNANRCKYFQF